MSVWCTLRAIAGISSWSVWSLKCSLDSLPLILVKISLYFPLLVVKGICHYWTYSYLFPGGQNASGDSGEEKPVRCMARTNNLLEIMAALFLRADDAELKSKQLKAGGFAAWGLGGAKRRERGTPKVAAWAHNFEGPSCCCPCLTPRIPGLQT